MLPFRLTVDSSLTHDVGEEEKEEDEDEEQVEKHGSLLVDRRKVMVAATDGMLPLWVGLAPNEDTLLIIAAAGAPAAAWVRANSSINHYHGHKHGGKLTWQSAGEACGQHTSQWRSAERRWNASTIKEVGI